MNKPRIAVLCGGKFAFPALQILALEKYLAGIALGGNEAGTAELQAEAERSALPFLHIKNKGGEQALLQWLDDINAEAVFSICFPFRLSPELLKSRPGRFINFHTGPLPAFRGPMPIFEVIKNREKETALSVHLMDENFDEGPVIMNEPVQLSKGETFGSLATKLSECASLTALNIAQMLEFGTNIPSGSQQSEDARYYPKPGPADTFIRWEYMQAEEIIALVNACNPWNTGAEALIGGKKVSIIAAEETDHTHNTLPGTILGADEKGLHIACIEGKAINVTIISNEKGIIPAATLVPRAAVRR